jgi:hypothetical protein
MTDRSAFNDDEWKALAEAPLQITVALMAAGPHRPVAMVKEAAASAREIARPDVHGAADALIAEIAKDAKGHEARHDVEARRPGDTPDAIVERAIAALQQAVAALGAIPADEGAEVRAWYGNIAQALAGASKSITSDEQRVLDRIATLLAAPASPASPPT